MAVLALPPVTITSEKRSMRMFLKLLLFAATVAVSQQKPDAPPASISEKTGGMEKHPGFFTYYWDAKGGKVYLEISRWNEEFLYMNSLPTGVGSNDIGLDRGQLGGGRIVRFQRSG